LGGQVLTGSAAAGSLSVQLVAGVDNLAANLGNRNNSAVLPLPTTPRLFTPGAPNANTSFVQNLYRSLLGREGDAPGVAHFANAIAAGVSRQVVINLFMTSDEWYGRFVDSYYQLYLGRAADTGGRNYWISQFRGGMSAEVFTTALLTSAEANA